MKRKICVITGSRSEYGILKPLINEIVEDPDLTLQIIATAMHLSSEFGLTYQEIENDGFEINEKIETLLSSDTPVGISKSMGLTIIGFAESYIRLVPDIVIGLGDRFELMSAVTAAHIAGIPVAHIGGGEVTEGAIDDAFRHSITKMSQLHFTSVEEYRKRVIQLGENPRRVFCVGELALDRIEGMPLMSKEEIEDRLGIQFRRRNILVTYHPVTIGDDVSAEQFRFLLDVLAEHNETNIIFTKANADTYGRIINKMIDEYVARNDANSYSFDSLGSLCYLSLLQYVDAVVGNSSSGIVEAPSFMIGTINIGDRQKGRIRSESVIDCEPTNKQISLAFEKLYSDNFQKELKGVENVYSMKDKSAAKIKDVLKGIDLTSVKKSFYDIN